MEQNLPVDYTEIIVRYMSSQSEDDFGKLMFNGINYEFDSLNDANTLIRVTNKDSGVIYNITEFDYGETYRAMPEVLDLMRYLENQLDYTVKDWLHYYTKDYPVYSGITVDIYNSSDGDIMYIRQKIKQGNGFVIKDGGVPLVSGGVYFVPNIIGDLTKINMLNFSINDIGVNMNNTSNEVSNWIKYVLNNEHLLSCVKSFDDTSSNDVQDLNPRVWQLSKAIMWCGLDIKIDRESKRVSVEHDKFSYSIPERGQWVKNKIEEQSNVSQNYLRKMYFTNTYSSPAENAFVSAIVNMLNEVVKDYPIEVTLEQAEDNDV